jgi:hypothetical protein
MQILLEATHAQTVLLGPTEIQMGGLPCLTASIVIQENMLLLREALFAQIALQGNIQIQLGLFQSWPASYVARGVILPKWLLVLYLSVLNVQ